MSSKILTDMEQLKFTASAMLVFFVLQEQSRYHEDGRVPVARTWFTEHIGITDKAVRGALEALKKAGWISIQKRPGTYSFARVTYREEGAQKGQHDGQQKGRPVIVLEPLEKGQQKGQEKGQQKGLPGVAVVVDVSPGVDTAVSLSVSKEVLQNTAAKKSAASEVEKLEDKAPGFRKMCDHITAAWTEKKKGRIQGWPKESWVQLAHQTKRFQCHEIAALWDEYLKSTDPFIVGQSHPLTWFCTRAIDGIADICDYKRRGLEYENFWNGKGADPRQRASVIPPVFASKQQTRANAQPPKNTTPDTPATPEQIAQMHRDAVKAMPGYCKRKPCVMCEAAAPVKELAVAGAAKRPAPF